MTKTKALEKANEEYRKLANRGWSEEQVAVSMFFRGASFAMVESEKIDRLVMG